MTLQSQVFNLAQLVKQGLNQPPLLCHSLREGGDIFCLGCAPGETFECDRCHRLMPLCYGASDGFDEICDACWCNLQRNAKQVVKEVVGGDR